MRRIAPVILLALAMGGCGACRRSTNIDAADASPTDASAEARSASAPGRWKAHHAAHALGGAALTRLEDGALVLSSGLFIHLVRPDGSMTTLGAPSAYAPFVSESEEDVGGYDVTTRHELLVSGSSGRLFAQSFTSQQTFLWDGQSWSKTTETPPAPTYPLLAFQSTSAESGIDRSALPLTHPWESYVTFADGRHAWLGDSDDGQELFVEAKPAGGTVVPLPKLPNVSSRRCSFVESADDHLYAHCIGYGVESGPIDSLSRLEGTTWLAIPLPRMDGGSATPKAVDTEGGIWLTDGLAVLRATRDGKVETIPLAKDTSERPPFYVSYNDALFAMNSRPPPATDEGKNDAPLRSWAGTSITRDAPAGEPRVNQIVPRRSGDVWVLAYGQASLSLQRVATDGKEHPAELLRSPTDDHVAIRNQRPLRTWVGHCNHVFVTLASAAKGEPLPTERVLARKAEIDAIAAKLSKPDKPSAQTSLVAGRLGDREVVGVVFLRSEPEASEPDMEAAATALIQRFTTDPASPPPATCTLPILQQRFDDRP